MGQCAKQVLIVESDPLVASFLRNLLDELGYFCESASFGADALWIADKYRPDVALVDIGLRSEQDGLALARIMRERFGLRIVLLSGARDEDLIAEAQQIPEAVLLRKPARASEIVRALDSATNPANDARNPGGVPAGSTAFRA